MALQKSIDTQSGVSATYWRITNIVYDMLTRSIYLNLSGYFSQETRQENKDSLRTNFYIVSVAADKTFEDYTRAFLYDYLKSIDSSFTDALDV